MTDISNLRTTIVPKSDQLNSDQLLSGPITIQITDVRAGASEEQPVAIHYDGDNGRPYKPCKTMRKVLIAAWGDNGHNWIGRGLTLFNEPNVKFGGIMVGGIRISHMSDIEQELALAVVATKGKKERHTIKPLGAMKPMPPVNLAPVEQATTMEELRAALLAAQKQCRSQADRDALVAAKDKRKQELAQESV